VEIACPSGGKNCIEMKRKIVSFLLLFLTVIVTISFAQKGKQEFYEIKIYTLRDRSQQSRVDAYLKDAYIPAMHRAGIKSIGVFVPVESDTTSGKRIYVLTPYSSLDQFTKLTVGVLSDPDYLTSGRDYIDAVYTNAPYARIESMLLRAFSGMPSIGLPVLATPRSERIYELRSYESPTEKIHVNKVKMFNDGDEVGLFKRLGFNAVFYGDVISGSHMPNLMYMTTFANRASRDEHWKSFSDDSQWKNLKAMEEYQNNVSKNTIYFLHPVEYSDY